jgi:hypothetical protein
MASRPHFEHASTCPPSAAVRQRRMAFSTLRCTFSAVFEKALSGCADDVGHLDGRPRHLLRTVAGIVFPGEGQRVERARGSVQAFLRKVEIDGGLFQIAMPQQDLDGPQIRSVFQQVSGEAVTQGVIVVLIISFPLRSAIVITRATQQKSNLFAI